MIIFIQCIIFNDCLFAELHKLDSQQKIPFPKILASEHVDARSLYTMVPMTIF